MKIKTNVGMVVSGHKEATKAGMKILKLGGNAMDAAIAAASTLAVAIPNMNGLGGDSIALWYDAKKKRISVINGSGKSPNKATRKYFLSKGLKKIPQRGPLSISIPGAVHAWEVALKKYGTKKFNIILKDSIKLSKEGIKIDKYLKNFLESKMYKRLIKNNKNLSEIYGSSKKVKINSKIKQLKLSKTLLEISKHGSKVFYDGKISKILISDIKKKGSIITNSDFKNHRTLIQTPISVNYLNKKIFTAPPNSQGLALIKLCEAFKKKNKKSKLIDIDYYLKSKKKAFELRDTFCIDPSLINLSKKKLNKIGTKSSYQKKISGDTSTLVVIDKHGNAVSWVQSLFEPFGSGVVSHNTGVVLHNRLYLEKISGKYKNFLKPNKRPFHTLCPCIVLDNKKIDLTIATPGDHGQAQTIFQIINFIYNNKYSLKKSINIPRLRHDNGNLILIEKGYQKFFLKNKKTKIKVFENKNRIFGGVTAIKVNSNKTLARGADNRRNCF